MTLNLRKYLSKISMEVNQFFLLSEADLKVKISFEQTLTHIRGGGELGAVTIHTVI
jgi:hypothetical protein